MLSEGCCKSVDTCCPAYTQADINLNTQDETSLRRSYFQSRINEIFWQKRRELEVLAGFDKLEKIKDSFVDQVWAETDPTKLPALLVQFDSTAVKQCVFTGETFKDVFKN